MCAVDAKSEVKCVVEANGTSVSTGGSVGLEATKMTSRRRRKNSNRFLGYFRALRHACTLLSSFFSFLLLFHEKEREINGPIDLTKCWRNSSNPKAST